MFRFVWSRAGVLGSILNEPDKKVRVRLAFQKCEVVVPLGNVRYTLTRTNTDSSFILADFGPKGRETNHVVIAGGSRHSLESFFRNNSTMRFPGFTR